MLEKDVANIENCLYAIGHIEEYLANTHSIEDLENDSKTYDAVTMNFVIIAESCARLSEELKSRHSEVDWDGVRRFRNYLAHDYFGVDIYVVWNSITISLPMLKEGLKKILENQ